MMAAAQSQSVDVACVGLVPFMAGIGQGIPWVTIGIPYPKAQQPARTKTVGQQYSEYLAFAASLHPG
jgi:hypothetical protein